MHRSPLSSVLLLFTAFTLTACTNPGPIAPNAARPDVPTSASLGSGSGASDNLTIPVSFTIPGGTCGVASTVTGNGLFHIVSRATQTGTGAWHVSFSWSAHGTAARMTVLGTTCDPLPMLRLPDLEPDAIRSATARQDRGIDAHQSSGGID